MDRAENALLLGSSAGGVATAIYCDRFRGFLPSAFRVKCFSDGGYFFLSNHHIKGNQFLSFFKGLINLHGSTDALPKSCTSKLTAALCFFPPNLKDGIYTPIFFLNSAFDLVQINYTLSIEYADCANHRNCSSRQVRVLQDLRTELLEFLPPLTSNSTKGVLINSYPSHTRLFDPTWNSMAPVANETYNQLLRDWYFDRKRVQIIDQNPCPDVDCTRPPY
ncbi:unnamed protein product [Cuscuta epithymum]|uniref:Pectin acetylesterase n=1 Tax=Cuscuta epithymum TaxID=186058 RepID=A0AAV0FP82_9ASTE|nr:unnamed protein product [Cuscuta epithymum]